MKDVNFKINRVHYMPITFNENRLRIRFLIAKFQNTGFKEKSYKRKWLYCDGPRITAALDNFNSNTRRDRAVGQWLDGSDLKLFFWSAWLARLIEHVTLDFRIVSSSPIVGVELT